MDIPSLFMIPSAVSSGKVHSVFPNSTDADFDFNRDSDATRVNSEGLIERVGYYGSELITNGDFATDSNWTKGAGWTIANGKATVTSSITDSIYQDALTLGKTFKVTFQITNITSGSLRVGIGINFSDYFTEVGTYTFYGQPSNDTLLRINPSSGTNASIDNVSVKEITGDRARLNYEIEGGLVNTKPSLLLEPQSTNLLTYSEDFSDSSWTSQAVGSTVTSNSIVSPDGTLNADTIQGNGSSTFVHIRKNINLTTASHTFSIFAKKGTNNFLAVQAQYYSGATNTAVIFDLNNRIVTSGSGNIEDYGNEWLKCSYTVVISSDVTGRFLIGLAYNGTTIEFPSTLTANGKNIYIYGAQLEQLSYSTSYIPTNGSVQSRANETCNGAGTSSILPSEEGILYCQIAALADDLSFRIISISDGSNDNIIKLGYRSDSNNIYYEVRSGAASQAFQKYTSSDITQFHKVAVKYKANDFAMWVNGTQVLSDTSGLTPTGFNDLSFALGGSSSIFYGKIRDIRVYNTKEMTDSEVDILLTKITS
jgi:hypothetical protein